MLWRMTSLFSCQTVLENLICFLVLGTCYIKCLLMPVPRLVVVWVNWWQWGVKVIHCIDFSLRLKCPSYLPLQDFTIFMAKKLLLMQESIFRHFFIDFQKLCPHKYYWIKPKLDITISIPVACNFCIGPRDAGKYLSLIYPMAISHLSSSIGRPCENWLQNFWQVSKFPFYRNKISQKCTSEFCSLTLPPFLTCMILS